MSIALLKKANPPSDLRRLQLPSVLVALAVAGTALLSGCDRSCPRLADKLCEQASLSGDKNADEQCEAWKARTKRVSKESCQTALKHLELQR